MDDSMVESVFEDAVSSDAFSPEPKPIKAKAAPKKAATGAATKPKAAPKKPAAAKPAASKKQAKPISDNENSDIDMDTGGQRDDDDSLLLNTPPSAKVQKKAPGPKKSSGKPLQPIENDSHGLDGAQDITVPTKQKSKTNTEQYQKLTQLEHILKRPDTYIGSVERTEQQMWVFNSTTESMETRKVHFVPGLYKIFDEILVNAADNKVRDKNMDEIRVTIDKEIGEISVLNNGRGIPIEIHQSEKIYIPELIFGHLLTSSNYDDDEAKITGGRNGYGAKLCNVYSTEFTLETADSKTKQKYKQSWTENMSKMGKAKITPHKGDDFTKITFKPDFGKFGMDKIDDDFEALVKRRVYDMAGTCKGVKVYLNGERLKVKDFKKYMEMYTKALRSETEIKKDDDNGEEAVPVVSEATVILTDRPNERWEVGFAVSDGSFQQVSFVNSIATTSGGTHVNYIADQIIDKLLETVKKRNKGGVALKSSQIKNHIFLFVNCHITNPAFTSQTKEQLTTKQSQFGSKCTLSEKFLKAVGNTEAVNNILHFAEKKADQLLKKSDGSKRARMNNAKLTDANKAGTKDGHRCTLILTEGDSASLLALAGRAVVDPDLIGVFPLRGKLLNVRDASVDQITKNQEIQNIKKFLGLQHKRVYEDTKSLRYGHLMIMTDQDHDGSHIKGLLINFLEVQFPSLLKIKGFLQEFITPIVKVWKGDPKNPKKMQSFFTMPEYEAWKLLPGNDRGWEHKYYKGLGTSSPDDAQVYFRDPDQHLKEFHPMRAHEPALIDLAFSKKKADARKEWLRQFRPGTYLDMTANEIYYEEFINKELILFSMADNMRSIPSIVDGFKPGQRKVLYTCFRRNLKKDVKVVELAGSVSGLTAYAYGETSLQQTIVGLAQNFVGSNNINCLEPSGNFGSRLQGGSDAASARYIYTRLSPFARRVFHASDEPLLTYNLDDGKTIEPEVYVPVLPMILVNGADGIGTGWSSSIPNYNPEEIVENLKLRMAGSAKEDMKPMKPWFRGWKGEAEDLGDSKFKFSGQVRQTGDNEVEITELPVRMWTQDFKDKLEDIIKAEKVISFIKDYTEYNTPVNVHFIVKMDDRNMKFAIERGFEETFKLSKTMTTTNLVAFDGQGRINRYATVLDIMEEFYHIRLKFYALRKEYLINEMNNDLDKMSNQAKFIKMIVDGKLVISKKKKAVLVAELREKGFKPIPKISDARKAGEFEAVVDEAAERGEDSEETSQSDYDYLLGMAIWSLTQERIDKLMKQIGDKEEEITVLSDTSVKQLWMKDLDDFLEEWRFQLDDEAKRAKKVANMGRRASSKLKIAAKNKKRKAYADDGDSDSDFASSSKPSKKAATEKTSKLSQWLDKPVNPLTKLSATATVEQLPVAPPPATERGLIELDGADDTPLKREESVPVVAKAAARAASQQPKPGKKPAKPSSDNEDDDVFVELANEVKATEKVKPAAAASGSRQGRGVAKKPVKYAVSSDDDSDNGDDLLGDVGNMVKGITSGNVLSGAPPLKPLFSNTTSRPSSSSGLGLTSKPRASTRGAALSDIEDETDYQNLVPKDSPVKQAARSARETILSDDDEHDSFAKATSKTPLRASSSALTKPKTSAAATANASKLKKSSSGADDFDIDVVMDGLDGSSDVKKKPAGSKLTKPSGKAAAGSLAKPPAKSKTAPAAAGKKKTGRGAAARAVESDDDEAEAEASNMMSDDDDLIAVGAKKTKKAAPAPAATAARPARRAAAAKAKAKYMIADDSDEEASDDGFDDESD